MFRKIALAFAAAASIAAVAPASAHGMHMGGGHGMQGGGFHGGGHHFFHGGRFFGTGFYSVDDPCYRVIPTEFGPRRVYVCD